MSENKNAIPVLGIPYYNRADLLQRLMSSIDYPIEELVIINNRNDQWDGECRLRTEIMPLIGTVTIIFHPNAGCAGAWNETIKLFPNAPYWVLVNNDIQFAPGDLARMAEACREDKPMPGCFYANHGASFWAVTERGVAEVGLFDENFYPAYLEDCDWSRRADLLQVPRVNVQGCASVHGDGRLTGSCTVNSELALREQNIRTHQGNFSYYVEKWGGRNEKETFRRPFDNPDWPLSHWVFDLARRRRQQWAPTCVGAKAPGGAAVEGTKE